ncbi:MAG: succinate dehydrogenase, cytochrome b556 subunit [Thiothrix nivea]|nr:MAG: succinate dehydrogenase, cytochrome b556 subunit [Thiothrix nivea]
MKTSSNRPLSPHLQVYKPQLTSVLSIFHRGTGVVIAIGSILVAYWLSSVASGPDAYATASAILGSFLGKLILFGWTWALFYHLCNGIRHLLWDFGFGFELPTTYLTGKIVLGTSVVLTVLLWLVA